MKLPGIFGLVKVLSRIADALDRAYPPEPKDPRRHLSFRRSELSDLTTYDPQADYEAEQEEDRQRGLIGTLLSSDGEQEQSDV